MSKKTKKKTRKRAVKKSATRKKSIKKRKSRKKAPTRAKLRKEFNTFAEGVAKLESLRHELNSLNTRGFDSEVSVIKSKLKDVSAIPQISRNLSDLRRKIESQRRTRRKRLKIVSPQTLKKFNTLEKESSSIKRKISHLQRNIENKKHLSTTQEHHIRDIPKLERELNALKTRFSQHTKYSKMKFDPDMSF